MINNGRYYLRCRVCSSFIVLMMVLIVSGCVSNVDHRVSPAPDQPWVPRDEDKTALWSLAGSDDSQPTPTHVIPDFSIPENPARAQFRQNEFIDSEQRYGLPELIDLAQRTNPETRAAWQRARQAAIAVGMVESTYLPFIAASVVGGSQTVTVPLPEIFGQRHIDNTEQGSAQILSLQWLLFDFGQRKALTMEGQQVAVAANILFNGTHQKLIFDVSQAYYGYGAAIQRRSFAEEALHNAQDIQAAVAARADQGLATTMDVAQARQAVAQAKFRRIQAIGDERTAYYHLLAIVGVNSELNVDAANITQHPLPKPIDTPMDRLIQQALSQRPDVAASYAALQASKAGVDAAQAGYLPKVYLGASASWGSGNFDISGLPSISQQGSGNSVLLGITVPIYDGGLRSARVTEAKSRFEAAEDEFQRVQNAAVAEIIAAHNALRTAHEAYHAATELVAAASITYEAAIAAYRNDIGTIDAITVADTALLDARQVQGDAHVATLISSVNLAFIMGKLTSRESLL